MENNIAQNKKFSKQKKMNDSSIDLENLYGARNYAPLPVVLSRGEGVHVWDTHGKCYIDMMSAYSAVSHGHSHPELVKILTDQASRLAIVSRAFYTDRLGVFLEKICKAAGLPRALPMNTGAEAVETALKAVRKWAYSVKGVEKDKAEIICCAGNFHGRTISIVGMSSESQYRQGFGPFSPGFKQIAYGNIEALRAAITPNTAAFLLEPIQGEGGIIVPTKGYLSECAKICRENNVLLIADEIQTGMGRTGKFLACDYEEVTPDVLVLGKSLGGGLLPVSMMLCSDEVMDVFTPGDHGSTFGGNPLAAVVGTAAIDILFRDDLIIKAYENGQYFKDRLLAINSPIIAEVRGKGLMIGVVINSRTRSAHELCLRMLDEGVLTRETHETVIRFAPPLLITREQIDQVVSVIEKVIA